MVARKMMTPSPNSHRPTTLLHILGMCLLASMFVATSLRPAGAQVQPVDRVIARLNEDILTISDVAEAAAQTGRESRLSSELVGALLDRTLLLQAAKKAMVDVPDDDMDRQVEELVAELRSHYDSDAAFRQALLEEHQTLERLKEELRRKAVIDYKLYRVVAARISLSDRDVAQYEKSVLANEGTPPAAFHLRQLSVPITGKGNAGKEEALSRVAEKLSRINAEGLSFAEGVKKYSNDALAKASGGDLGFMPADSLAPKVLQAVKSLKPGEVTPPMITGANASIFYLDSKRGARTTLFQERYGEERTKLLDELRKKARLQVYDPEFAKFVPETYRGLMETAHGSATTTPNSGSAKP